MARSVESKIKVGVALTLIVLLVNAFLSFRATKTLINNDLWVRHTYEVLSELEGTLSTIKDAETGERGYIITGEDAYLQPYEDAIARIDGHTQRLEQLTADDPTERAKIPILEQKINDRLASLKMGIELRKNADTQGARRLILSGVGKQMMDDLRQYISTMEVVENQRLDERVMQSRASQRNTIITFVVANLVACIVLVLTTLATLRGIDARKRAEARAKEHRHLFEVTLASIADGVIVCDTSGLVTFINPVAQALTGWMQEEPIGQSISNVFKIVNEETRETVENPALRAIQDGAVVGLKNHTVLVTRSGTEMPIDDNAAPIRTGDGNIVGAVLVFRDMTARRSAEAERTKLLADTESARERAESANRAKDEFLAVLSHELRTPLTSIFGWIQLLRTRNVDYAMRNKALEVIDRNVRVQTNLIDDLLNISQIMAGTLRIRKQMMDPVQGVKVAIETARPFAEAKAIRLVLESNCDVPMIYADPARFQQIVWNLLSNAVKFSPKGDVITLQIHSMRSELEIVVADNGEGISKQFLPQVFNRFTQADQSATRAHGGLGLGLALVRQLVDLHGGSVSVESPGLGQGSRFTIRFPIRGAIGKLPVAG